MDFQEDIYNYTFIRLLISDDHKEHYQLMLKASLSFGMQITLVFLVMAGKWYFKDVFLGNYLINDARVICALILHVSLMPEIRCSLDLMSFCANNKDLLRRNKGTCSYVNIGLPFLLSLMKLIGGFITEIANIIVIVESSSAIFVVKDFIALGSIAEIDNMMYGTLKDIDFEEDKEHELLKYRK